MTAVLGVLYLIIRLALYQNHAVTGQAAEYLSLPLRYHEGLRPVDLIHIGDFIQEWIPPRH